MISYVPKPSTLEIYCHFKFKPTSLLKVNEIDFPSWATIQVTKTLEDCEVARDAISNLRHFTSAITIPPYLAQAHMSLQGPSASEVYMEILQVSEVFDTEKED